MEQALRLAQLLRRGPTRRPRPRSYRCSGTCCGTLRRPAGSRPAYAPAQRRRAQPPGPPAPVAPSQPLPAGPASLADRAVSRRRLRQIRSEAVAAKILCVPQRSGLLPPWSLVSCLRVVRSSARRLSSEPRTPLSLPLCLPLSQDHSAAVSLRTPLAVQCSKVVLCRTTSTTLRMPASSPANCETQEPQRSASHELSAQSL